LIRRAGFCALLIASAVSLNAAAAEPTVEAREAYAEGARSYDTRDYANAARWFARADELSPNLTALKLALISATRADDAVLTMALVRRAQVRQLDDETRSLTDRAQERFSQNVALVRVRCRTVKCHARIAGHVVGDGELAVVTPGVVAVEFVQGARVEAVRVEVAAEQTADVAEPVDPVVTPPASRAEQLGAKPQRLLVSQPTPAAAQHSRLPRAVFWGGVALTGALGAATAISGIDARSKRERFEGNRSVEPRDSAQRAVERTNWLLGTALVSGAVTAVVGVFFSDFGDSRSSTSRATTTSVLVF
jgi:hypothetical protein